MPTDEQIREQFEEIIKASRSDAYILLRRARDDYYDDYATKWTEDLWRIYKRGWTARDAEVQALKEQVQKLRSAIEYWAYRMDETHPRGYPRFNHETQEWEPTASWRETPDVTDLMTAQKMLLAALAGEEGRNRP